MYNDKPFKLALVIEGEGINGFNDVLEIPYSGMDESMLEQMIIQEQVDDAIYDFLAVLEPVISACRMVEAVLPADDDSLEEMIYHLEIIVVTAIDGDNSRYWPAEVKIQWTLGEGWGRKLMLFQADRSSPQQEQANIRIVFGDHSILQQLVEIMAAKDQLMIPAVVGVLNHLRHATEKTEQELQKLLIRFLSEVCSLSVPTLIFNEEIGLEQLCDKLA